jgi:hypothetical protein
MNLSIKDYIGLALFIVILGLAYYVYTLAQKTGQNAMDVLATLFNGKPDVTPQQAAANDTASAGSAPTTLSSLNDPSTQQYLTSLAGNSVNN